MEITNKQIKALREAAISAGDYRQADLCDRALTLDSDTVDQDGNQIALSDVTQAQARTECARVIREGQGDS